MPSAYCYLCTYMHSKNNNIVVKNFCFYYIHTYTQINEWNFDTFKWFHLESYLSWLRSFFPPYFQIYSYLFFYILKWYLFKKIQHADSWVILILQRTRNNLYYLKRVKKLHLLIIELINVIICNFYSFIFSFYVCNSWLYSFLLG